MLACLQGNGLFCATYTATSAGTYTGRVWLGSQLLATAAFAPRVHAALPCIEHTEVKA